MAELTLCDLKNIITEQTLLIKDVLQRVIHLEKIVSNSICASVSSESVGPSSEVPIVTECSTECSAVGAAVCTQCPSRPIVELPICATLPEPSTSGTNGTSDCTQDQNPFPALPVPPATVTNNNKLPVIRSDKLPVIRSRKMTTRSANKSDLAAKADAAVLLPSTSATGVLSEPLSSSAPLPLLNSQLQGEAEPWKVVTRKQRVTVRGNQKCDRKLTQDKLFFHCYPLHPDTTSDDVLSYLNHLLKAAYTVDKIKSKGDYSSFKISMPQSAVPEVLKAEHWPSRCYIKEWQVRIATPRLPKINS